ncbi:transposase [Frankia sp. CiP3]|uniref:transposase n=1 Tax=Frankia sp. CiP3 TaxID=2880971 RepID=UPI001EF659E4|nr:transposase [Frankia sp. CiP3]
MVEIAKSLGINESTLGNWVTKAKNASAATVASRSASRSTNSWYVGLPVDSTS